MTKNEKLSASAIAALVILLGGFEGVRHSPYRDPVGVLTVCYGHTGDDIEKGRKYTEAECVAMLKKDIVKHAAALRCVTKELDFKQQIAFTSFAYNIGQSKFCGGNGYKMSTVVKKANAGDMMGACAAMSAWRNGCKNGVCTPLPGLVNRRAVERAICEGDFAAAAATIKRVGLPGVMVKAVDEIAEYEEQHAVGGDCKCEGDVK